MLDNAFAPMCLARPSPLVQNIEDMQIVYIFEDGDEMDDFDPDGNDTPNDNTDNYENIRSVRLTVLARTHDEMQEPVFIEADGEREQIEDHPGSGTPDHYRRFQLTTEVKIRNMGL
jgi:hypothetical protein